MKRVDVNKMKAAAESWAETFLAWLIGLPTPFTAVGLLVLVGGAFAAGAILL